MNSIYNKTMIVTGSLLLLLSPLFVNPLLAKDKKDKAKDKVEEVKDKAKEGLDKVANDLKGLIEKFSDKAEEGKAAIQKYFDEYSWKGLVQGKATTGVATLEDLYLNDRKTAVAVYPGEKIKGKIRVTLDPAKCANLSLYRIVIGIKGQGPQNTICNYPGFAAGTSDETFKLYAPSQPGLYEIRFRPVDKYTKGGALDAWYDDKGQEPDASTTIGLIYVTQ